MNNSPASTSLRARARQNGSGKPVRSSRRLNGRSRQNRAAQPTDGATSSPPPLGAVAGEGGGAQKDSWVQAHLLNSPPRKRPQAGEGADRVCRPRRVHLAEKHLGLGRRDHRQQKIGFPLAPRIDRV